MKFNIQSSMLFFILEACKYARGRPNTRFEYGQGERPQHNVASLRARFEQKPEPAPVYGRDYGRGANIRRKPLVNMVPETPTLASPPMSPSHIPESPAMISPHVPESPAMSPPHTPVHTPEPMISPLSPEMEGGKMAEIQANPMIERPTVLGMPEPPVSSHPPPAPALPTEHTHLPFSEIPSPVESSTVPLGEPTTTTVSSVDVGRPSELMQSVIQPPEHYEHHEIAPEGHTPPGSPAIDVLSLSPEMPYESLHIPPHSPTSSEMSSPTSSEMSSPTSSEMSSPTSSEIHSYSPTHSPAIPEMFTPPASPSEAHPIHIYDTPYTEPSSPVGMSPHSILTTPVPEEMHSGHTPAFVSGDISPEPPAFAPGPGMGPAPHAEGPKQTPKHTIQLENWESEQVEDPVMMTGLHAHSSPSSSGYAESIHSDPSSPTTAKTADVGTQIPTESDVFEMHL